MLAVHNTHDWPLERLLGYGPQITAAMNKLAERFPKDVSVPGLAAEILAGRRQLWLVLDGARFVSFVLTEVKVNDMTGHRMVAITDLAGEDGEASVALIGAIEQWAIGEDAAEMVIVGRPGWKRSLAKEGYAADVMTFRKTLEKSA